MSMDIAAQRYGRVAIALHWTIALFVLCALGLGLAMDYLDAGETKTTVNDLHKSVGITIFAFTAVRLGWRIGHRPPPLPVAMPRAQRVAAVSTHVLLYGLTLAMPVSGYVSVAARARETTLYWLIDVPRWVPLDRALARTAETLHTNAQYVLYVLLAAHVGAALYHAAILKDGVFQRMRPQLR